MKTRLRSIAVLVVLAGCEEIFPPALQDPVYYDLVVVTKTFTDDIFTGGKTSARNDTASMTFVADVKTTAARFDPAGPCNVTTGAVTIGADLVSAKFPRGDGGPHFSMTGVADSTGAMAGDWKCDTFTGSPHGYTYAGTFRLTRRP